MTGRAGLAVIAIAGLVPWIIVFGDGSSGSLTMVFAFGLLTPDPLHVTSLSAYLTTLTRGVPRSLLAWPVATLLWFVTLAGGLTAVITGREDRRVTGGLLLLAGFSLIPVAVAVGRPGTVTAVPVGTVVLWAVAWWQYGDALRRILVDRGATER